MSRFALNGQFARLPIIGTIIVSLSVGCDRHSGTTRPLPTTTSKAAEKPATADPEQVKKFCADCHVMPPAASFPKRNWQEEVEVGYKFFYASKRTDLVAPPMQPVVRYFQEQAPEELVFPQHERNPSERVRLRRQLVELPDTREAPSVSYVTTFASDEALQLVFCDMARGVLNEVGLGDRNTLTATRLSDVPHPSHIAEADLDGDGRRDWIIANLGSFLPEDHHQGSVLWTKQLKDPPMVIAADLGRIADARAGDFDGDGDEDVIVAEFGWQVTGRILLLENNGVMDGVPHLHQHVIDKRHGAIHAIPVDLNRDGRLDFITVLAQEHEVVEVFLSTTDASAATNKSPTGKFAFERKRLYSAPDPAFGSSGIDVVDLDGDGDLDVLYTNGDAFDSGMPKPYHAIHWLENRSEFPFTHHQLAVMPGVHRAIPGDLDGDGDLDIVASAYLPGNPSQSYPQARFDGLMWLEQTSDKQFIEHTIESDGCQYAACTLADLDRDGDLDIIAGVFHDSKTKRWLEIWWNDVMK